MAALGVPGPEPAPAANTAVEPKAPASVEELIGELGDADPLTRGAAAEALGKRKDERALKELLAAAAGEDQNLRWGAVKGLGDSGDKRALKPLLALLGHADKVTRWKAVEALDRLGDKRAVLPLIKSLREDGYVFVRKAAAEALGRFRDKRAEPALREAAAGGDEELAPWAAAALQDIRRPAKGKEAAGVD